MELIHNTVQNLLVAFILFWLNVNGVIHRLDNTQIRGTQVLFPVLRGLESTVQRSDVNKGPKRQRVHPERKTECSTS